MTTDTTEADVLDLLAAQLLSRVVFSFKSRSGLSGLNNVLRFLRLYANSSAKLAGNHYPAPCPELAADGPCRNGQAVWKSLGTSYDEEQAFWKNLTETDGVDAVVDRERLYSYVLPEYWPVVKQVIVDGPAVFRERALTALRLYRDTAVRPNKRRPEGGYMMQGSINVQASAGTQLARPLVDLFSAQDRHPAAQYLSAWKVAKTPSIHGEVESHETEITTVAHGPVPAPQVRLLWQELTAEIRGGLRMTADEHDELAALQRLVARASSLPTTRTRRTQRTHVARTGPPKYSPAQRALGGLFGPLRERAMLTLLCILGSRGESLTEVKQELVVRRRNPGAPILGPAVRITPYKSSDGRTPRWKPIPEDAWMVLEVYRQYVIAWRKLSKLPPLTKSDPFFLSTRDRTTKWQLTGVEDWLGGKHPQKDGKGGGIIAALPLDPQADRYTGYTPHSVRKTLRLWLAGDAAHEYAKERNIPVSRLEVWAETALDHKLDDLASLYKGDSTVAGKEHNAAAAAALAWELLTTDRGKRRIPDGESYRQALIQRKVAREQREALVSEFVQMCREAERTGRELSHTVMMGRMVEMDQLVSQEVDAEKVILAAEQHALRVSIADDIPEDKVPKVDLASIRDQVLDGKRAPQLRRRRRVRNWLTPDELARVLGVGASTIRAWLTNGLPRSKPVWSEAGVHKFSETRRAILSDKVNELYIDTPERRDLLADILGEDAPVGWTTFPRMVGEANRAA